MTEIAILEIREQIYPYLLITSMTSTTIEAQGQNLSGPHRIYRSTEFNRVVQIDIDEGDDLDPSKVSMFPQCGTDTIIFEPLYPEILYTCRTIWQEATPCLHKENHFTFWGPYQNQCDAQLAPEAIRGCKELMAFDIDKWNNENVPEPIRSSTLAAFLRKIGPSNSSMIQNLYLHSEDIYNAAIDTALATQLCAHHMPSLKTLQVRVKVKGAYGSWLEQMYQGYVAAFSDFSPMCKSLEKFVHPVHWLEFLQHDTHNFPQVMSDWFKVLENIHLLEHLVKARVSTRKLKVDERWKAKQEDSQRNQLIATDRDEGFVEFWHMVERNRVDRFSV